MVFKKANKIKELEAKISTMDSVMTPEMRDAVALKEAISNLNKEAEQLRNNIAIDKAAAEKDKAKYEVEKSNLNTQIQNLKKRNYRMQ